ncbi:acylneuraminate cytidylyltransferase [Shewanella khirikhana]|uniref:cytidylyltransferase domain-containing protein n=1 Tax=Shewanella khirikhana TaxID=1965282 RepID=UPI0030CF0D70
MSKTLAIIGARLNSSRLPGKHLLPLPADAYGGSKPMIGHLLARLSACKKLGSIELATTADDYNAPLVNWAYENHVQCQPFEGDVNDLMGRLDVIIQRHQPDYILYICGDCPLIDPEFIDHALTQLQASMSDTICLHPGVNSLHEGMGFYSKNGWDKLMAVSQCAMSREHVGYGDKLTQVLDTLAIDDSADYSLVKHRISVDTQADYRFMAEVYRRWFAANPETSPVSLAWVQNELLADPALTAINAHVKQKTADKSYVKASIYCHFGPTIGLGHFKRALLIADALQEYLGIGTSIHLYSENGQRLDSNAKLVWHHDQQQMLDALEADPNQLVMIDFHPNFIDLPHFKTRLKALGLRGSKRIGIDKMAPLLDELDWLYVPSFYSPLLDQKVSYGWKNYLFSNSSSSSRHTNKSGQILVLSGGSDALGYGQQLPSLLENLSTDRQIIWIQGPLAQRPNIAKTSSIKVLQDPSNLSALIGSAEIILSCYGLSLFESIYAGAATILLPVQHLCDRDELAALEKENCCLISQSLEQATDLLQQLLKDKNQIQALARETERVFGQHQGLKVLMDGISNLVEHR